MFGGCLGLSLKEFRTSDRNRFYQVLKLLERGFFQNMRIGFFQLGDSSGAKSPGRSSEIARFELPETF